jgi:hypothetical protein
VNFKLSPGIRGPEHTGKGYGCVDENNCDEEVYFLCAQHSVNASVHCLAAMDSTSGSPKIKAQACATAEKADFSKIDACFGSDQANTLKAAAATYFDKKFPKPVGVPHIEINGVAVAGDRSKATIISKLCATGIKAGACGGVTIV